MTILIPTASGQPDDVTSLRSRRNSSIDSARVFLDANARAALNRLRAVILERTKIRASISTALRLALLDYTGRLTRNPNGLAKGEIDMQLKANVIAAAGRDKMNEKHGKKDKQS